MTFPGPIESASLLALLCVALSRLRRRASVLRLLSDGLPMAQVAKALGIDVTTVRRIRGGA